MAKPARCGFSALSANSFSACPSTVTYSRIHLLTAGAYGVSEGTRVRIGNKRGSVVVCATLDDGQLPDTLVVEGVWPASSFEEERGINTLVGEDPVPPNGGVAFHDIAVWLRLL